MQVKSRLVAVNDARDCVTQLAMYCKLLGMEHLLDSLLDIDNSLQGEKDTIEFAMEVESFVFENEEV